MTFRLAVVVLVICSLLGCTARREVTRPSAGTVAQRVNVGDQIRVFGKNGRIYHLEITEMGDGYLRGVNRELNKAYKIPLSQIEHMEYQEFSALKTTGAVIGGAYALMLLGFVILLLSLDGTCLDDGI